MNNDSGEDDQIFDEGEESGGFSVDFSGVEAQTFETIPRGNYEVKVTKSTFVAESQSSGQPMIGLTLEIQDGDLAGKKFYATLSLSPKALPFTKPALAILDPALVQGRMDPEKVCDEGGLLGKSAYINLGIQKYQGEDRNQVKKWSPSRAKGNEFLQA